MSRNDSNRRSALSLKEPWWFAEDQIQLSDVPRILPPLPNGRRKSLAAVYRWTTAGLLGIRLGRYRCGGVWCTTRQELARWQASLTASAEAES